MSTFAYWTRLLARVVLVLAFSTYSAAKFAGAQFITAGETLDKPVADLSGIELTWVYFGYSSLYANFVAVGQLVAAALLVFNRTARLGAATLLPITTNIVVVNFAFRIGTDTQIVSSVLLALNLYLLVWDLSVWKRVFWTDTVGPTGSRLTGPIKAATFVAGVSALTWLLVAQNQPAGGISPLAGEWLVETTTIDGRPATDPVLGAGWRWVCFDERNRMSVRTNRWTFHGRCDVDATGITVRYDPEPVPPVYPGQPVSDRTSEADQRRLLGEQGAKYRWPNELRGTYRRDDGKLIVTLIRGSETIEWTLSPYTRPKF